MEQKTININNIYRELLLEFAYLMNLFERDKESFYYEIFNRADNDVSRLNILAFNPSTHDTYIESFNNSRLYFILAKERYRTAWGTRFDAVYMVVGLNDNRSVYAYTLDKWDHRQFNEVFRYDIDLWQLDFDSNGYLIIPYNMFVRIQGDLVVRRFTEIFVDTRSVMDINIPVDVPVSDVDKYLKPAEKFITLSQDFIRYVKKEHRLNKRFNQCTYINIHRYDIFKRWSRSESEEKPGYYAINLSWIGGVRHRIEYYGYEPHQGTNNVLIKVLTDTVRVIHPAHIPITLKVNPGDVLEFTLLEQTMDAINTNLVLSGFDYIERDRVMGDDRSRTNIFIATVIFQRFLLPSRYKRYIDRLYWYLSKYGVDVLIEKTIEKAMNSEFRIVLSNADIDFIQNVIRKALDHYYREMINQIEYYISPEDISKPVGKLLTYIMFFPGPKAVSRYRLTSFECVKNDIEYWKREYTVKIVENDLNEFLNIFGNINDKEDGYDSRKIRKVKKILKLIKDLGLSFKIIMIKTDSSDNNMYDVQYICVDDKVCISV